MPNPGNEAEWVDVNVKVTDANYLETYGLQLVAGRFLHHRDTMTNAPSVPFDKRTYVFVVNETATEALGYTKPEQALGRRVQIGLNKIQAEIIGVVKDYHTNSLHEAIRPVVMMNFPYFYHSVGIKLNTPNYPATLSSIEKTWKQFNPDMLYEARFLDDSLQELYQEEARQFTLLRISAGLALLIGCLGLWGLSTFLIERRTKEIGIRKVLGASVSSIVTLLSKDFVRLISLAFLLASPIAWYLMHQWLKDFAYQTPISGWIFALTGLAALVIALVTVSFQAVKAAMANPVKSLRTE
jgi:ABC-type antimicrobial peptide transport system permease subunit